MTAGQRRWQSKTLYVHSNDPITPVVLLDVTGYVSSARLILSPESIDFGKPRRNETVSREILIPRFEEDKIDVNSVSSNSPYVIAKLSDRKYNGQPCSVVTVVLKPGAPVGEFKSTITVSSNHPKQPNAEIPVKAYIRGDVDLNPDSLFFGIVKSGMEGKTSIKISTVGRDLKIQRIDCSLKCISLEITPRIEGKEYIITATLSSSAGKGSIKGEIIIHTNILDQPKIEVPVCGYVEDAGSRKTANQPPAQK
jgi:hypothetical protein